MKSCKRIILTAISIVIFSCNSQPVSSSNASEIQMIFWEIQSWETGGGRSRLTIWSDGRSEVMVVPDAYFRTRSEKIRLRDGWEIRQSQQKYYFVRTNVFLEDVAKNKFNQALAAGIRLLKSFKSSYVDGDGTLVGVQINGELKETVIPMFMDQNRGSANHQRFIAVSKVLSGFDRHAYDIQD